MKIFYTYMKIGVINRNASNLIDDEYIPVLIDNDVNILNDSVHDRIIRIPTYYFQQYIIQFLDEK